jgi:hypothetical protein
MKKIKLFLKYVFLILIISGCTNVVNYDDNKEYFTDSNEIQYYKGSPFTGIAESYNEAGQLNFRIKFKDGKRNGLHEQYYLNGQLSEKVNYKNGKLHGSFESYYQNGQLFKKGENKNGEQDGPFEEYYENGQLTKKASYKDGVKDGPYEEYYNTGQLISKGTYIDGKLVGPEKLLFNKNTIDRDLKIFTEGKGNIYSRILKIYIDNNDTGGIENWSELENNSFEFIKINKTDFPSTLQGEIISYIEMRKENRMFKGQQDILKSIDYSSGYGEYILCETPDCIKNTKLNLTKIKAIEKKIVDLKRGEIVSTNFKGKNKWHDHYNAIMPIYNQIIKSFKILDNYSKVDFDVEKVKDEIYNILWYQIKYFGSQFPEAIGIIESLYSLDSFEENIKTIPSNLIVEYYKLIVSNFFDEILMTYLGKDADLYPEYSRSKSDRLWYIQREL